MITSLARFGGDQFIINCLTTGSPATTVDWVKHSTPLQNDATYQLTQELVDGRTATYNNLLTVRGTPNEVIGPYTCTIQNSVSEATSIQGEFTGWKDTILTGLAKYKMAVRL